jgi:hypothetical protein
MARLCLRRYAEEEEEGEAGGTVDRAGVLLAVA